MNKFTLKTVLLSFIVALPMTVAIAADIKIGVVNTPKILDQAPQAEAATKKLEQEFAPREKAIVESQKKLQSMEEKLDRDGAIMSDAEHKKLERDVVALKRDLRRDQDEFREDLNMRRNEELGKLQRRIKDVIDVLAHEGKYDLILYEGVVYASDKVDITDQVLDRLKTLKDNADGTNKNNTK